MTPTWRFSRPSSAATTWSSASCGDRPFASRSSRSLPYSTRVPPCVATAPTPARTHGTAFPTHGFLVVTTTPVSPVLGSTATMENVWKSMSATAAPRRRLLGAGKGREEQRGDERERSCGSTSCAAGGMILRAVAICRRRLPVNPRGTDFVQRCMLRDLSFGFRLIRRAPGMALTAALTLALGIAATTRARQRRLRGARQPAAVPGFAAPRPGVAQRAAGAHLWLRVVPALPGLARQSAAVHRPGRVGAAGDDAGRPRGPGAGERRHRLEPRTSR